jgi:two-component system, LytTR family, sensor kinase
MISASLSTTRRFVPLLIHILVWATLGLTLLVFQPLRWNVPLPTQFWVMQGAFFLLSVALFYFNAYLLVPRFLFRDRPIIFLLLCLASALGVVTIIDLLNDWLNLPDLMHQVFSGGRPRERGRSLFSSFRGPLNIFNTLLILCVSTSIEAVKKWQKDAQLRYTLEQQKISSELSFLKAQINPHFFFNTLNNIYALTMFDVEASRKALLTLSRMMRYVLYETQTEQAYLSKEIAFIQDYINLMQLRLTDKVTVTFEKPEPLKDMPVAPMLFLPFVENAFKHGISATQPSHIFISLRQHGPELEVEVRNSVFEEKVKTLEESNGIGLVNTQRRLDLIYPGRYTLEVTNGTPGTEFRIYLKLNLA